MGAVLLGAPPPPPLLPATAPRRVHRATLFIGIKAPAEELQLLLVPLMEAWAGETRRFLEASSDPAAISMETEELDALAAAVFFGGRRDAV